MTKKFIGSAAVAIAALLLPFAASAATTYDDVTLSNSVDLVVNSVTVDITSSSAALASTTVDSTNFTLLMGPASNITMVAPGFSHSAAASWVTINSCSGGYTTLRLVAPSDAATTSITVTPSASFCSSGTGGSGGSSGGGGGGGSPSPSPTPTPVATSTATTTPTVTPTPTPAPTPTSASPVASEVLTLVAQLKQLIALFESLGGTVAPETKALLAAFPSPTANFARNLEVGMTGDDVKGLQVWLNTHGYQVAASGAGSPGNETSRFGAATRAALIKFQKAKGISPAAGYFGPKTRAVLNAM